MTPRARSVVIAAVACALWLPTIRAQSKTGYREYQLGSSLGAVSTLLGVSAADARTLHQRPAIVQELSWRRGYGVITPVDSVQRMFFSFYNDQLYRLVVEYDRDLTEGLSAMDMTDALSAVYGVPVISRGARSIALLDNESAVEVSQWVAAEQTVVLYHASYPPVFKLFVTSPRLEKLAVAAVAQARRQDEREAPQREVERQRLEAAAARDAQEKARTANKGTFRP